MAFGHILNPHERKRVDHSSDKVVRGEHDDLIIDVLVTGVHAKSVHKGGVVAIDIAVFLDDDRCRREILRNPLAVLQVCGCESHGYADDKQIPVVQDLEDPFTCIETGGFFLQQCLLLRFIYFSVGHVSGQKRVV